MTKKMLKRLTPDHLLPLADLFSVIRNDPSAKSFHPHDFDDESAFAIANYKGGDIYAGYFESEDSISAYGMLRGRDAGFEIPSLGIYVAPQARGRGISQKMMIALHDMARVELGASKVRLKVYADNLPALKLYERLGYEFETKEGREYVGYYTMID